MTIIQSLTEVRAWARASRNLAEREGFPLAAQRVQDNIDVMNKWDEEDVVSLAIVPADELVAAAKYRQRTLRTTAQLRSLSALQRREALREACRQMEADENPTITILDFLENGIDHVLDNL